MTTNQLTNSNKKHKYMQFCIKFSTNTEKMQEGGKMSNNEEISGKPLLFIKKFKELIDLRDSMSKKEIDLLFAGLEYLELHEKYPKYVRL